MDPVAHPSGTAPETRPGVFTVSLDFELYWGVRDKRSLETYGANLRGVRQAIPAMLERFEAHGIHATWAAVGFLFLKDRADFLAHQPEVLPAYGDATLSPYEYAKGVPDLDPLYHFAPELLAAIAKCPHQEIASHTYSHYYCLEAGQTLEAFRADLACAVEVAERLGVRPRSLVFPRNQFNPGFLEAVAEAGFHAVRGNEAHWLYRAADKGGHSPLRRALRLVDHYLNLSGHHTHALDFDATRLPMDIPASRFLRPYSRRLAALEGLRLRRITEAMTDAAQRRRLFHLWWHPHNFGANLQENLRFLDRILAHFDGLKAEYGMESLHMEELAHRTMGSQVPVS